MSGFASVLGVTIFTIALLMQPGVATAAAADDHPAFTPVKQLFAAMSAHDGPAMHATATSDFQLLEHGEVWSMQKLVEAVQPNGKPYQRDNFFQQIHAHQQHNMAWISYWNKAQINRDGTTRTVVWLESAVLIMTNDQWKIQMLHSTRLDPAKHPQNIEWKQFQTKRGKASSAHAD